MRHHPDEGYIMYRLTAKLKALGSARAASNVLPQLALEVAKAAARGAINEGHVNEIYLDYFQATKPGEKIDPYSGAVKANASKLRQIVKAADPELLARVTAVHHKICHKQPRTCRPLYAAMVLACRIKISKGRRVSDAELARIVKRPA
jgi:hypothetical protein